MPCSHVTQARIDEGVLFKQSQAVTTPFSRVITSELGREAKSGDPLNTTSTTDQDLVPQLAAADMPIVKMPGYWSHAANLLVPPSLELIFRGQRITRQDLRLQQAPNASWTEKLKVYFANS